MSDSTEQHIPALQIQPPTADFIDQRLPSHHPLFATSSAYHHEPPSHQYPSTSSSSELVVRPGIAQSQPPTYTHVANARPQNVIDASGCARPVWTDIKAMKFWNELFPVALDRFRSTVVEPKGQAGTNYSIRQESDWEAIFSKLEQAQCLYQDETGGGRPGRWFRKMRRKGADNLDAIAEGTRNFAHAIPDSIFSTPVTGVIQMVLDAASTAAGVRGQVLEGFDNLIPTFSNIELFLGTFPKDVGIRGASIDLIVATLQAIEKSIGFFVSNEMSRGFKALGLGDHYAAKLIQSLEDINNKSESLMKEANKSHIHEFHTYAQHTRQFGQHIVNGQEQLTTAMNAIQQLLAGHIEERDRQLAIEREQRRREMEASMQEIVYLRIENGRLRSASPTGQGHVPSAPPSPRFSSNNLRRLLSSLDVDLDDISFVLDTSEALPWRQRAQVEQVIQTAAFRRWIMSPFSTKILVHWDRRPPEQVSKVSPLSTFVASLVQSFQGDDTRFIAAVWFCSLHTSQYGVSSNGGGAAMLASLVDQILRQHQLDLSSSSSPVETGQVEINALQAGEIPASLVMLEWLVRQLPETTTLVFLIDGVAMYEQEEHDALDILASLVRLVEDTTLGAVVKVMFTSTPGTDVVRAAFEAEDLIVNVEVLPRLGWAPSDERVARELGSLVME